MSRKNTTCLLPKKGQQLRCRELMSLLDRAEATATGITAKGIRALRMMCDGYSCREISAHYDTTPNNITA